MKRSTVMRIIYAFILIGMSFPAAFADVQKQIMQAAEATAAITNCYQVALRTFEILSTGQSLVTKTFDSSGFRSLHDFRSVLPEEGHDRVLLCHLKTGPNTFNHSMVLVKQGAMYRLLYALINAFTLHEWLQGDFQRLERVRKLDNMKGCEHSIRVSKGEECLKAFRTIRSHLEVIQINTVVNALHKMNTPMSRQDFDRKVITPLRMCVANIEDTPFQNLTCSPRSFLGIHPKDKVSLEVVAANLISAEDALPSETPGAL